MPESDSKPNRSVTQLIHTETIKDMGAHLKKLQSESTKWQTHLKKKQEEYFEIEFESTAPSVQETNGARRFLNQFIDPKLAEVQAMDPEPQQEATRFILPFNSEGGIRDFLVHFFQLEIKEGQMEYLERDPYEKEAHILYDIYKIKKTIECIDVMRKTIGNPEKQFKSRFTDEEKKKILEELREVLKVLVKYSVMPEHQKYIYQKLDVEYLSGPSILERREKRILYCYPHVIEKYDYRNLFFLIYFRTGLVTKIASKAHEYHYNYYHFEILKQEYLLDWLEKRLKNNPDKQKIYENCEVDGRTIASWIAEDPSKEIALLKQLPGNKFNNLVAQVNEQVDDQHKAEIPSLSEKHGDLGEFKQNVKNSTKLFRSPLDKLKKLFRKTEPPPQKKMEHLPAPEPKPEPEPEPEIKITPLKAKQVPFFFLCQSASKYNGQLSMCRVKLGSHFNLLTKLVNKMMSTYGENGVARRRTPKHDWTVPFLIQHILGEKSTDFLFILGGEAKTKSKGMGYSRGDEYTFIPYFVFAAKEADSKYGEAVEERSVSGQIFHEYPVTNPAVIEKVIKYMTLIKEKEFPEL
ncbi:hypothetical protein WDW89_05355 [Deltaproteobacteria bacterium TL4]